MQTPRLREGFAGQEMFVIPRPVLAEARRHPLVRSICPTDIGWYPQARFHYRDRPDGAEQDHLMMCVGGSGCVSVDGQLHELRSGQLLIIPRNRRHTSWASDETPWSLFWMHYMGDDADYFLERMPGTAVPVEVDTAAQREARGLFRACLAALDTGYSLPNLIYASQSASHILALLLFRNAALPPEAGRISRGAQLESMVEYMLENLENPLRLEDLARHAGHSVSHFSEWFKAQTGQSPMAHFEQLRIRAACRLLDLTDQPVKAIAQEAGYPDPYYFSRVFKKVMGVSPEAYRVIAKG